MKSRLTLLLLAALPLFGQARVGTIYPASGPVAGNTYIHILGANLLGLPLLCPAPICSNFVQIAGVDAPIVSQTKGEIVALVPAHAAGSANVVVNISGTPPITIANGYRYDADADDEYERILLPIVINARGAFGSDWHTSLLIHNGSNQPLTPIGACTPPFLISRCGPPLVVAPHATVTLPIASDSNNPSAFIHVPRAVAHLVDISIRVQDLSRQSQTWGTSIPAVRGEQYRRVVRLQDIPTDFRFRAALRIYSYATIGRPVSVRVYDQKTNEQLVSAQLELAAPTFFADDPPPAAAFAQIGALADAYPQIRGHDLVRIEVESAFIPPDPLWAFASVTNNETQHVTTIAP